MLFVAAGAYLAAVFLVSDARRFGDAELERYFAVRARRGGGRWPAWSPSPGIFVLRSDARYIYDGLTSEGLPLVCARRRAALAALVSCGAARGAACARSPSAPWSA